MSNPESVHVLGYSTHIQIERVAVKWLGILGLLISVPLILNVLLDFIWLAIGTPPQWFRDTLDVSRALSRGTPIYSRNWTEYVHLMDRSLVWPLINLFLLAGSIGCLRRYARTRWWMVTYAVLAMAIIVARALEPVVTYMYAPAFLFRYRWSWEAFIADALNFVSSTSLDLAFVIVLFWIMTRRSVVAFFAEQQASL